MTAYQGIEQTHLRPLTHEATWIRAVGLGAGLGLVWGIAMRVWMRFISSNPEFSVEGTAFILAASAIAGSVNGLARHRRSAGGQGWWRLSLLTLLLLGAAGAVMWPTVILWAIAIGRKRPWWLVAPLLVAGALVQIPVVDETILADWRRGALVASLAVVWYIPMLAAEAWGFSIAFARARPDVAVARWKRVVIGVPIVAAAALATLVVGAAM
jgi:hypothetical protein